MLFAPPPQGDDDVDNLAEYLPPGEDDITNLFDATADNLRRLLLLVRSAHL